MIAVDASAVMAVLMHEPDRTTIIKATVGETLVASTTLWWEIGNALSDKIRRDILDQDLAREALESFLEMREGMLLVDPDLRASLEIAFKRNIYAYDAYVLQNAIDHEAELLTLDKAMRAHARALGIRVIEL